MRTKLLLITGILLFALSATAQKLPYDVSKKEVKIQRLPAFLDTPSSEVSQPVSYTPKNSGSVGELEVIPVGSTRNGFSILLPQQRCLWYDKNLDALVSTFRGNNKASVQPIFATGDDIVSSTSTDRGASWNRKLTLAATSGKIYRYPSGVFVNPTGNTNFANVLDFVGGPTSVGGIWSEYYFASQLPDGSNGNVQSFQMPASAPGLFRNGLFACEDGTVHMLGDTDDDPGTNIQNGRTIVRNGTYNPSTKTIDWMSDVVIIPTIASDADGEVFSSGATRMTWTNDGSIGYICMAGVDATGTRSAIYPIIYKSTDKGATWQKLPYFDFASLSIVSDYLRHAFTHNGQGTVAVPRFDEFDITVGADGNLNVMAGIRGHYYENNIDSIYYIFTTEHKQVFNFVYDGSQWQGYHIQRLATFEVDASTSPYKQTTTGGGGVSYDMRLHAVRSYDGKKVFALWTNTLAINADADSLDLKPDLFIWGYKIGDDHVITEMAEPACPSNFQAADAICYFMYASPIAMETTDGEEFPVTIADLESTSFNADEPCIINYVKNAIVPNDAFTKQRTAVKPNQEVVAEVSGNYPNPFSGMTQFDITLKKTMPVSLTVSTVTGQKVFSQNYGLIAAGKKETLQIDASNLKSGVYIYTITAGESKSSHKMIVK